MSFLKQRYFQIRFSNTQASGGADFLDEKSKEDLFKKIHEELVEQMKLFAQQVDTDTITSGALQNAFKIAIESLIAEKLGDQAMENLATQGQAGEKINQLREEFLESGIGGYGQQLEELEKKLEQKSTEAEKESKEGEKPKEENRNQNEIEAEIEEDDTEAEIATNIQAQQKRGFYVAGEEDPNDPDKRVTGGVGQYDELAAAGIDRKEIDQTGGNSQKPNQSTTGNGFTPQNTNTNPGAGGIPNQNQNPGNSTQNPQNPAQDNSNNPNIQDNSANSNGSEPNLDNSPNQKPAQDNSNNVDNSSEQNTPDTSNTQNGKGKIDTKADPSTMHNDRWEQERQANPDHPEGHEDRLNEADLKRHDAKNGQDKEGNPLSPEQKEKLNQEADVMEQKFVRRNSTPTQRMDHAIDKIEDSVANRFKRAANLRNSGDEDGAKTEENKIQKALDIKKKLMGERYPLDKKKVAEEAGKKLLGVAKNTTTALAEFAAPVMAFFLQVILPIILILVMIILLFVFGYTVYCKPIEVVRDGIELAAAGASAVVNPIGTTVDIVVNGLTFKSPIRKFYESLPGCDGAAMANSCPANTVAWFNGPNGWQRIGKGQADESSGLGDGDSCIAQKLSGKSDTDTIQLWRANAGKVSQAQFKVGDLRKVLDAGTKAKVPTRIIMWVIALAPTESGFNFDIYDGTNQCYGIIQFCQSANAGQMYQTLSQRAFGKIIPGEELRKSPEKQMIMAWEGYKEKKNINCKLFPGKSELYAISASWLGCTRSGDAYGTKPPDYGEAAVRNFDLFACNNLSAKAITPTLSESDIEQNTASNVLDIFKPIQVDASATNPNSPATGGPAIGNNKIPEDKLKEINNLQKTGKISMDYNVSVYDQAKNGLLNIATVDFIIALAAYYDNVNFSALNNLNHSGLGHGNGVALDINNFKKNGKQIIIEDGYRNAGAAREASLEMARIASDLGVRAVVTNEVFAPILLQDRNRFASSSGSGKPFVQVVSSHHHHYHFEVTPDKAVNNTKDTSTIANVGKNTVFCCPEGVSPTGGGEFDQDINSYSETVTVSKGGPFTTEVRAYMDTLAWKESANNYGAADGKPNAFNPAASTDLKPVDISKLSNKNIGRYQYMPSDVQYANAALKQAGIEFTVTNYTPQHQDYGALGRWVMRAFEAGEKKSMADLLSAGEFNQVVCVASREFSSSPVLSGCKHARPAESHVTIEQYKNYYDKRLAFYKSQAKSGEDTFNLNQLLALLSPLKAEAAGDMLDLGAIAKQTNAQSIIVSEIGGGSSNYNSNQSPASPASTLKIIIADMVLSQNVNLNKKIIPKASQMYNQKESQDADEKVKPGNSYTVSQLLQLMLEHSNNNASNILIDEVGGPGGSTQIANKLGYTGTQIPSYYNVNGSGGAKVSTGNDLNKAMLKIFSNSNAGYILAQQALKSNPHTFNYEGRIAHKHGNTNSVLGNVTIIEINGKKYAVTLFFNTSSTQYITNIDNALTYRFVQGNPVDKAMSLIIDALKKSQKLGQSDSGSTIVPVSGAGCFPAGPATGVSDTPSIVGGANVDGFADPAPKVPVNSPYGYRSGGFHKGVDKAAATGTPIGASAAGKVIVAEMGSDANQNRGFGNVVIIDHQNGYFTRYAHLSAFSVQSGQTVTQGQEVGKMGSTGNSSGPHLHFEIRKGSSLGDALDPCLTVKPKMLGCS